MVDVLHIVAYRVFTYDVVNVEMNFPRICASKELVFESLLSEGALGGGSSKFSIFVNFVGFTEYSRVTT